MILRFTQDIQTKQTVYVVCNNDGTPKTLTTDITKAIQLTQVK